MMFAKRKTYLINKEGVIFKVYQKVDVSMHSQEILAEFKAYYNSEKP